MESKFKRWMTAALPLAMACLVSANGKVTDVSTRQIDGGIAVHIVGNDLSQPSTKWDGGALVVSFDADFAGKGRTLKPNNGGIKAYSFAKEGHRVNVAVRPLGSKESRIVKVEDGWLVYFEEAVPSTVPQYSSFSANKPATALQKPQTFAPVNPRDFRSKALVTLNFVDTDIVQILKALAMQANVNVAMGPDVTGKVTINLENVPVEDAMSMVTTLGGVRYAYVNNTYVVSSKANFSDTMEAMSGRGNMASETRVIPLFSREGTQVKAAILKMVPPSTESGRYELVLPSEKLEVQQVQAVNVPGDGKDDKGASNQTATMVQQKSDQSSPKKDDYIVLVGTPGRMDAVESAVRSLDSQICKALGITMGENQATVTRTFEPKGILANDLVKALAGDGKNEFDGVKLVATPGASSAKQAIVLSGHQSDVVRVMSLLTELDSAPDAADTVYEVVNLKYIRPNYVWSQLEMNVPGLKASFLPPPIDPKTGIDYSEEGTMNAAKGNGGGGPSGSGDNGGGNGGGNSGGPSTGGNGGSGSGSGSGSGGGGNNTLGSNGQVSTNVATSTKANTFPLKLLLRGTREQIDAAKQYLAMVDIAPRQVAVELRVMELSHDEALKVGLDWSVLTGGTLQSIRFNNGLSSADVPGGVSSDLKFRGGGTASILGALDQVSTKNNVLARPSILVNDGVPTNIFVGDEVRYVKAITNAQNGGGLQVVTDEVDVGVDFNVTARVGADGNILLDLQPTLKVLQGFTDVPGGGQLPQTSRRSAATQMTIKSGETIAIGGLIQDQDRKVHGGIPILRDLPLIGHLFGRTNNVKDRSEVVFFVTVKEVSESDRQGAANPRQAERDNTKWPGNKDGKKG